MTETMHVQDSIHGAQGRAYITIEGNRYLFAQLINIKAEVKKSKVEVPIMGRMFKGHKSVGLGGTGTATFHYNTSIFRELVYRYQETGKDFYFDIQVTNEDNTSNVGRQTTILKDCNIDGAIVALLDANEATLEDEVSFTFERMEFPETFSILDVMQQ